MIGLHWNIFSELWSWAKWPYNLKLSLRRLGIRQMQRCWRGYLGRLRWDSATSESFISGNVCLLRRSKSGATQVKQSWRISLRSLVTCTYHQSQFWIELSCSYCSSALSKCFPDFHWVNGSLNFEWPLPSHETGWQTCWLKWTGAGTLLAKAKANHEMMTMTNDKMILDVCFPQEISCWTSPLGSTESLSD